MSVFETLNSINVNGHTEKKKTGSRELTYLSWAWAWAEVKKAYPDAFYTIYERPDGCIYWTDGRTCWVKTGVTIEGLEHIEYLPVMDYRNQSIQLENITSMDVNKAIQRSLTKAAARHGLGLYIYAGEDLPEGDEPEKQEPAKKEPSPLMNRSQMVAQRKERMMAWCKSVGMTAKKCADCVASLRAGGAIPDIDLANMSDAEFEMLMDTLDKTFGGQP